MNTNFPWVKVLYFSSQIYTFKYILLISITTYCFELRMPDENITGDDENLNSYYWVWQLLLILAGYGTIFIPGYFAVQYFKRAKSIDHAGSGIISRLILACVIGQEVEKTENGSYSLLKTNPRGNESNRRKVGQFFFCFLGLQVSYLTWGILQEKIMTKEYTSFEGSKDSFGDSQFLVFVNRVLAFLLAGIYVSFSSQPRHIAPLYKYSYCSFSNIMSSWFQYEALKFVSFPTQVLAKASKIIPTMLMGKAVRNAKFEYYEYATALFISAGMTMFMLASPESTSSGTTTTVSGVILLASYMMFDSFTSNWQGKLFSQYKMSSVQMMLGVNLFSCLLTGVSLLQQGAFGASVSFMFRFPAFFYDCVVLSLCSACGQLFIYYTISSFGPVTFIIMMTIRQCLAVIASCILFLHPLPPLRVLALFIVFGSLFIRIYCSHRIQQIKRAKENQISSVKV